MRARPPEDARYRLYVADTHRHALSMIETASETVTIDTVFEHEDRPYGSAMSPNGVHLYVAHALTDSVLIADGLMKPLARIPDIDFPVGLAVSPNGAHLYASNYFADSCR